MRSATTVPVSSCYTRLAALACASVLAGACDSRPAPTPNTTAERAEPAEPPATAPRPPMSGYAKAHRVSIGPLARPIDPTAVFSAAHDWSRADEALRRLGRDARSGEVATLLVAGAAEPERDTGAASVDQWRQIGALVIAVVHEDAARGQRDHAVARLRAVAQLGRDVGDESTAAAAVRACAAIAHAADDPPLADQCAQLLPTAEGAR